MDILREFLESSTIHGLTYISSSRSKRAKATWFLVVMSSFSAAVILIYQSYMEWEDDPFSTDISTHNILDLDFPKVTICPPRDTNTALNYGLMKAGSRMSKDQQARLRNSTRKLFMIAPFVDFANQMVKVANPENLRRICEGKVSVPTPFKSSGFEVEASSVTGRITSPGFGETKPEYSTPGQNHYVLLLPENLDDLLENSSLKIELEVEVGGKVEFIAGSQFKYYSILKQWVSASNHCINEGGQLASLHTTADMEEVARVARKAGAKPTYWVGGKVQEDGKWGWSDKRPWDLQNWNSSQPNTDCGRNCGDCLEVNSTSNLWKTFRCSRARNFVCQFEPTALKGPIKTTLTYLKSDITFSSFQVWWPADQQNPTDVRTNGLSMNWTIGPLINERKFDSVSNSYTKFFIQMTNFAVQERMNNMSSQALKSMVLQKKAEIIEAGLFKHGSYCEGGRVQDVWWKGREWTKLGYPDLSTLSTTLYPNTTEQDLMTGFEIFSYFIYCPEELLKLYQFHMNLIATGNPRTLIQTTVNNLKLEKIKEKTNMKIVKSFFTDLDSVLNTNLGTIILALSSEADMKNLVRLEMPYTAHFSGAIRTCVKNDSCQALSQVIQDLGKPGGSDLQALKLLHF